MPWSDAKFSAGGVINLDHIAYKYCYFQSCTVSILLYRAHNVCQDISNLSVYALLTNTTFFTYMIQTQKFDYYLDNLV